MKLEIEIIVKDEEGDRIIVRNSSLSFESAEEALGKLERFVKRNFECPKCGFCDKYSCDNCEWCGTVPQEEPKKDEE